MSNATYVECLKCMRLLVKNDTCPDCGMSAGITDGTEYTDCGILRDSDDPRHAKNKCDCEEFYEDN